MKLNVSHHIECDHCGLSFTKNDHFVYNEKHFCCQGCSQVYQLLHSHDLQSYYQLNKTPGLKVRDEKFAFLDDLEVQEKIIEFAEEEHFLVQFEIPQIHCSSCLWLLENLPKLHPGIEKVTVRFAAKTCRILCNKAQISLRELAELLNNIGYAPKLNLSDLSTKQKSRQGINVKEWKKMAVAGFCFGNIMLLSFPEYFGFHKASHVFYLSYINLLLSIPVFFFAGWNYIESAYHSIIRRTTNMDIPIALGMLVLFSWSIIEILFLGREGYLDSFSGFVFFLLIGKWFQNFSYRNLDYEKDYTAYLPISVLKKVNTEYIATALTDINVKDYIFIKPNEIVPCDGINLSQEAELDYSFITGENRTIKKGQGEIILAGSKNKGQAIYLEVNKEVNDSYITSIWRSQDSSSKREGKMSAFTRKMSKYFLIGMLAISLSSFLAWWFIDSSKSLQVGVAVLIVACPCALALSLPFAYGTIIRLLGRVGYFVRNTGTIEHIQDLDSLCFDKTGTITDTSELVTIYEGKSLSSYDRANIRLGCSYSTHPVSLAISRSIYESWHTRIEFFNEVAGAGIEFIVEGNHYKIGSASYIFNSEEVKLGGSFLEINGEYYGIFKWSQWIREGVESSLEALSQVYDLHLISGDHEEGNKDIVDLFHQRTHTRFNLSPTDKVHYIEEQRRKGKKVAMIGDGLNDAGALKKADIGMVVVNDTAQFSPACDVLITGSRLHLLPHILRYIKQAKNIIYLLFGFSLLYNLIGLAFAVTGHLTPVVAAILMPASSITIILIGTVLTSILFQAQFHEHLHKDD